MSEQPQDPRAPRPELSAQDLVRMWRGISAVSEEAIPTLRTLASKVGLDAGAADPLTAVTRREAARVRAEEALLSRAADLAATARVADLVALAEVVATLGGPEGAGA